MSPVSELFVERADGRRACAGISEERPNDRSNRSALASKKKVLGQPAMSQGRGRWTHSLHTPVNQIVRDNERINFYILPCVFKAAQRPNSLSPKLTLPLCFNLYAIWFAGPSR